MNRSALRTATMLCFALFLIDGYRGLASQTSPRCTDAQFRQLDFWVGEWDVADSQRNPVGRSDVSSTLDGCAVREEWRSEGFHGISLSAYDKPDARWRQFWVDNFGAVLRLEGGWSGEELKLEGSRTGSDGKTRQIRMILTPMADGSIRQVQQRSEDGGSTWTLIFEGLYTRRQTGS